MAVNNDRRKDRLTPIKAIPNSDRTAIDRNISPHNFQIGLPDDLEFKSHLVVIGGARINSGITGSLQKLPDGTDYLRGDNNISIANNADGSITIGATGGFSGTLSNPLTAGDGVSLGSGGTTFTGASADTLAISLATNSGLGISSGKLKVDINSLTTATPAAGDFLIMRDNTDGVLKKFDFSSISTNAQASVTLNNSLTSGQGLAYTTTGNTYDNSAAKTMKVDFGSNSGLDFDSSSKLVISPATAAAVTTVADDDVVLIGDTSDSNNVKKVTIANLRPSSLSNPLSVGDGVEYTTSGTTYDNSAAKTIRAKGDGSTVSVSSSGISVVSTPGSLTHSTGIAPLNFNGSTNTVIAVDTNVVPLLGASNNAFTGNVTVAGNLQTKVLHGGDGADLIKAGSNVTISKNATHGTLTINASNNVDIGALPSAAPTRNDVMLFEDSDDSNNNKRSTAAAIADLVDRSTLVQGSDTISSVAPSPSTPALLSLKIANDTIGKTSSGIFVQKVPNSVQSGAGILPFSYDGSSAAIARIDDSVVATISGSDFAGIVKFSSGVSGSMQSLTTGEAYIIGGTGISVTTSSIGQVIITNTFDEEVSLASDNIVKGNGPINLSTDNGGITIDTPGDMIVNVTDSIFNGSVTAMQGLTGSLQKLTDGSPYLRSGNNVSITTGSDGAVTISVDNIRDKDIYTLAATNALTNIPITGSDASAVGFDPHLIDVFLNGSLMISGSATEVQNSQADYCLTGASTLQFSFPVETNDTLGVVINTASGGGGAAAADAPYVTFGTHDVLENERVVRASEFMSITTGSLGFIDFDVKKRKIFLEIPATLTAGNALDSTFDFSKATYDPQRIDVFVNGVLMVSGSNFDYYLQPTSNIIFTFDLFVDDHVTINVV